MLSTAAGSRVRAIVALLGLLSVQAVADPLPSWTDGDARSAIVHFVESVTAPGSDSFVPVADRIAVFDNDGTLWAEQPVYFQLLYAIDLVAARAKSDPAFASSDVLRAAAARDMAGVMAHGEAGLVEVINASHSGMTVDEFRQSARSWLDETPHPVLERPIFAAGNSDGDFEMLEWTTAGDGPRLGVLVHHTDAEREWAYDRDSHIGRLNRGLDEGPRRGWIIVDMKTDWRTVFPSTE